VDHLFSHLTRATGTMTMMIVPAVVAIAARADAVFAAP
jgi:hypothetical protein